MLSVKLNDITFSSPLLNASGCFNPELFNTMAPLNESMGGVVTKTVTQEPRPGNLQQRTVELPGIGMLNSIGLQNPGLNYFLETEVLMLAQYGVKIILSLSATSIEGFGTMVEIVTNHPNGHWVDAIEINLSCPNVAKGGVDFGISPGRVKACTEATVQASKCPVFAKLTPNITSILPVAEAAIEGGASAISAINTVVGCSIDIKNKKPYLNRISGGYSGPGIKPIALHAIWQIHHHFPETPIIGIGGISSANDVLEFMMAGASLVQIGTQSFRNPMIFSKIHQDLMAYGQSEGLQHLTDLTGCAHSQKMKRQSLIQ